MSQSLDTARDPSAARPGPHQPPGAPSRPPGSLVLALLVQGSAVCVVLVAFVVLFIGLQRDPAPHAMPIAVVAGPLSSAAAQGWGDKAEVITVADADAARAAVREHEAVAAMAPAAERGTVDVYLAGANGAGETAAATALTTGLAQAANLVPAITDLVPLARYDPRGLAGFYIAFGTTLASFILGQVLFSTAATLSLRGQVVVIAVFALAAGTLAAVLGGPVLGALPAAVPALALTLALLSAAVASITLALATVVGMPGLLVATLLLTVAGNALSGAALGPHLMPPPAAAIGAVLPPGAAFRAVTDLGYFDGAGITAPLLSLTGWAALALTVTTLCLRNRRKASQTTPA